MIIVLAQIANGGGIDKGWITCYHPKIRCYG